MTSEERRAGWQARARRIAQQRCRLDRLAREAREEEARLEEIARRHARR